MQQILLDTRSLMVDGYCLISQLNTRSAPRKAIHGIDDPIKLVTDSLLARRAFADAIS